VSANIIRLKAAAVGGVVRSGLGTNSRIAALPPGIMCAAHFVKEAGAGGRIQVMKEVGDERQIVVIAPPRNSWPPSRRILGASAEWHPEIQTAR
jgi:hypothetical protein